jgi:hypothetical protein
VIPVRSAPSYFASTTEGEVCPIRPSAGGWGATSRHRHPAKGVGCQRGERLICQRALKWSRGRHLAGRFILNAEAARARS